MLINNAVRLFVLHMYSFKSMSMWMAHRFCWFVVRYKRDVFDYEWMWYFWIVANIVTVKYKTTAAAGLLILA